MTPLQYAETIAYSTKETLQFTYDCAKKLADKEGDFVECGVAAGAQVIAMAYGAPNKTIYAFDSFEGIPLPSNRDDQMPGIRILTEAEQILLPDPGKQKLLTTGATSVIAEDVSGHLTKAGILEKNIIFVKGWFEETMPVNEVGSISLLRLDGDLYNSTYVCLKHLFSKVIEGGIVIIDDWMLRGSREACIDYFTSIKYQPKYEFISNIAYFYK